MANSFVRYTGNGSTSSYAVPFSYRAQADVTITIDGVATTAFTWDGAGTNITFTSPPANLSSIEIRRTTSQSSRLIDYADGSVLKENDLDTDSTQAFMMGQEAIDDANDRIKLDATDFHWDANSKRIKNVATPTGTNDSANKAYVDAVAGSATAAAASEANALTYKNAAETAKTAAEAALDTFDDDYLGAKSSDPATDNDGDALADGSLYFNTSENRMKVYDLGTTSWNYVSPSSSDQTKINTVSDNITAVSNVSTNLSSVQNFADVYRVASSAPADSLDVGDLYFDTTANELKVYKSSGWAAAGSTVNGTARRYTYNITGTPTTVSGADAKGETLAYDAGFVDVFLNGVRQSNTSGSYTGDVTVSSGTSVVFASALAAGDVVDVVAYGTFSAANIEASDITSGTINLARIPSITNAKLDGSIANAKLANSSITINGSAVALGGSVTVGETKPTITSTSLIIAPSTPTSVTIAGTNFASSSTVLPIIEAVSSTGVLTRASVVSWSSSTSISATFSLAQGDYRIRVENPDGNAVISTNAILQSTPAPTWTTSAGNISTIAGGASIGTLSVVATSDSAVTYAKTSGTLPNGITIGSNGVFAGTESGSTSTTVYSFDVTATDAESQTAVRTFTITISHGASGGGQFN